MNDDLDDIQWIWPDNWESFILFEAMSTQWRTGANGATGLEYSSLPTVAKMLGISEVTSPLFSDIRVMENEALNIIQEMRESNDKNR